MRKKFLFQIVDSDVVFYSCKMHVEELLGRVFENGAPDVLVSAEHDDGMKCSRCCGQVLEDGGILQEQLQRQESPARWLLQWDDPSGFGRTAIACDNHRDLCAGIDPNTAHFRLPVWDIATQPSCDWCETAAFIERGGRLVGGAWARRLPQWPQVSDEVSEQVSDDTPGGWGWDDNLRPCRLPAEEFGPFLERMDRAGGRGTSVLFLESRCRTPRAWAEWLKGYNDTLATALTTFNVINAGTTKTGKQLQNEWSAFRAKNRLLQQPAPPDDSGGFDVDDMPF